MMISRRTMGMNALLVSLLALTLGPAATPAQVTMEDYQRANELQDRFEGLALDVPERPGWIGESNRFWYRKSVEGGHAFTLVDAETRERSEPFDHDRLAEALNEATGEDYTGVTLPFQRFEFVDDLRAIRFSSGWGPGAEEWRCELEPYRCAEVVEEDAPDEDEEVVTSPDGRWEAFIQNYNVHVRDVETGDEFALSQEATEGNHYDLSSIEWSPDSEKLAAYRVIPGYVREVHYVESAPDDQLQPRHHTNEYTKPGDVLDKEQPVLFHVEEREQFQVDDALFPNAYNNSGFSWWEDGRAFTFEYNQRGHEVYRIIEVDAETGEPRALVSEEPETFFTYSSKRFRHDVGDGEEIIWMSERDGWNHLYMYDGQTGEVKHQITEGEWVVRSVVEVDEENRQIYFRAGGMNEGEDPYFVHYYRIDFDGSNLTTLTDAEGNHDVSFSPDMKYYVDTWSQVDQAPVSVLRRTEDREIVKVLEEADISALEEEGWRAPEVFTAKARDGETDIWGIIYKPTTFDPDEEYPVVEYIYAGPHSAHVPKSFSSYRSMQAQAELGFIVVQIDGMGTSHRSKDFHDVAWQNLGDAGFPDRILWHEAVAETYDWYDTSEVGIYGHSAGGQNAMGALLFHSDFYDVAVAGNGCHDNRMDKIWWNEQWMGYPLGDHYSESSNVDNAHKLEGELLLTVGEMDTNVDPASTYQVADALIEAGKDFHFLPLPGQGHTSGGDYGERRRMDFFVEHLTDSDPPRWNREADVANQE